MEKYIIFYTTKNDFGYALTNNEIPEGTEVQLTSGTKFMLFDSYKVVACYPVIGNVVTLADKILARAAHDKQHFLELLHCNRGFLKTGYQI